jgi:hypothetical protein
MKKKFILTICLLLVAGFFAGHALAQEPLEEAGKAITNFSKTVGIFSPATDVRTLTGKLVLSVMGIIGSLALVIFVYGGIMWMTAGGDSAKLTKAKNAMLWASLGLVAIFLSYVVVRFIIQVVAQ